MTYQELLALSPEDLLAKYVEVFGEQPEEGSNKQKIASAISKKLQAKEGEQPEEGSKSTDKDHTSSDSSTDDEDDTKETPVKDEKKQSPVIQIKKPDDVVDKVSDTTKIHLVKMQGNKIVDEMIIPSAVWNNAPAGQKVGWKVKTPDEVK